MIDKDLIIQKLKENKKILVEFGVEKIGLFGSYLSGNQDKNSDIDILVKLNRKNMYKNYCRVKYFLESIFSEEIDLITENQFEQNYITKLAKEKHEQTKKDILESVIYV